MLPWIFIHGYSGLSTGAGSSPSRLQCCHGFSSMDTEIFGSISITPISFNVAMDFHPWIPNIPNEGWNGALAASMLPWIFIHGYILECPCRFIRIWASMLPWIFIHGYKRILGVNWMEYILLQCCHGFSSMDTVVIGVVLILVYSASMLPWIFIHGYARRSPGMRLGNYCFNVAMDFHPWILQTSGRSTCRA